MVLVTRSWIMSSGFLDMVLISRLTYTYLPRTGAERESQLTSIRTEVLAGKGPDIFICSCPNFDYDNSKPLFLFPNQVMERRVFLPLDSYLENAEYME